MNAPLLNYSSLFATLFLDLLTFMTFVCWTQLIHLFFVKMRWSFNQFLTIFPIPNLSIIKQNRIQFSLTAFIIIIIFLLDLGSNSLYLSKYLSTR